MRLHHLVDLTIKYTRHILVDYIDKMATFHRRNINILYQLLKRITTVAGAMF